MANGYANIGDSLIFLSSLFLPQPFSVAEQFTGYEGKYVPLKETIRSFKEIIEGKHDQIPESCFLFAGSIDDVVAKYKGGEGA